MFKFNHLIHHLVKLLSGHCRCSPKLVFSKLPQGKRMITNFISVWATSGDAMLLDEKLVLLRVTWLLVFTETTKLHIVPCRLWSKLNSFLVQYSKLKTVYMYVAALEVPNFLIEYRIQFKKHSELLAGVVLLALIMRFNLCPACSACLSCLCPLVADLTSFHALT